MKIINKNKEKFSLFFEKDSKISQQNAAKPHFFTNFVFDTILQAYQRESQVASLGVAQRAKERVVA